MMQLGTGQPGPFYVGHSQLPVLSNRTRPRAMQKKGESLLCGEVHYGQDLSGLQDGS